MVDSLPNRLLQVFSIHLGLCHSLIHQLEALKIAVTISILQLLLELLLGKNLLRQFLTHLLSLLEYFAGSLLLFCEILVSVCLHNFIPFTVAHARRFARILCFKDFSSIFIDDLR